MSDKKVITVFGATGKQGGSVVSKFLSDPTLSKDWTVRAVTRDVSKDSAKALAAQGAEVVAANLDDSASLEKAMTGAYAVFAVTNYWEKLDAQLEEAQGKRLADAAAKTGVQHFIPSVLLNITEITNGALPNVHHFDAKARVAAYIKATHPNLPTTFFLPGFYASNILGGNLRQNDPSGPWTFALPVGETSAQIPVFDPEVDTGRFIKAIVLQRDSLLGQNVYAAGKYYTPADVLAEFKATFPEAAKVGGGPVFWGPTPEQFKGVLMQGMGLPEFAAQELLENMLVLDREGYFGGKEVSEGLLEKVGEKSNTLAETWRASEVGKNLK